jgi:AcrR family transcriptional regulator
MSPRVTPKNRIPDIVSAAVTVFSRRGYRLTQMEEIAKEAKVSKATLYYYFKSKLQLFQYVLQTAGDGRDHFPLPEDTQPPTEQAFLQMLKRRLKEGAVLTSVTRSLQQESNKAEVPAELSEILSELWDINEKNRTQIIMLEKSFYEFPELAEVYDRYGRKSLLQQIEQYLKTRMRQGAIRRLHSVEATARFLMESVAWFGFKQPAQPRQLFTKEEALPDLVAILAKGLKR